MKKTETYEQKIDRLVVEAKRDGQLMNDRYLLMLGDPGTESEWTLWVINRRTDQAEAFSSMKADFGPSLREFAEDYIA